MIVFVCNLCGFEYNSELGCPDAGIEPGVDFDDLPDDWTCPYCGAGKEEFEPVKTVENDDDEA